MTDRHERWADAAGAYLLEAMPADERADFERHLADCPECRREVEELRVAADALPMSVEPVAPPAALRERIMSVVRSEAELLSAAGTREATAAPAPRRRRERRRLGGWLLRPGVALACALALLVLGAAGGALLARGGDGAVRTVAARVDSAQAPGASVRLQVADEGSRLLVRGLPAPPAGRVYQVWLKRPGGAPQPTDVLWSPSRDGTAEVAVPGSLSGVEAVLVTDEPAGGARVPSKAPVITAIPA